LTAYIFDKILSQGARQGLLPARSRKAREWFRDRARTTRMAPSTLVKESTARMREEITIGEMYFFFYDPKHKKTLPYYDRFPLIFPIKKLPDGFIGINLHYLPPQLRAKLMDALYDISSDKRYDEKTKLRISYSILNATSRYKWFGPTVKRYLTSQIRSRFVQIESSEWDIALMLPMAKFQKATQDRVWADSRKAISRAV
jgi:hypothetical protein